MCGKRCSRLNADTVRSAKETVAETIENVTETVGETVETVKKTFDLESGSCLSGEPLEVSTYPVRLDGSDVFIELPPLHEMRDPVRAPAETAAG